MKKVLGALVIGISFWPISLQAQNEPSVQLRVDVAPKEVTIGDPIQVRLSVRYSQDLEPQPLILPEPLGEFELLDYQTQPPQNQSDGKKHLEQVLFITTFSTGPQTIPALALLFQLPDGQSAEAKTQEIDITVRSLLEELGDEGNLRPLKGFFNFRSYLWLWLLLGALVLGLAIFLLLKVLKRSKGEEKEAGPPPRPPEEVIWETLHELEQSGVLTEAKAKEFYSRLTGAVRVYLEGRFSISALDRTTAELTAEIRALNLVGEILQILKTVFESGDLVKFAKFAPTDEEMEADLERIKKFVHLSTPVKEETIKKEKVPL